MLATGAGKALAQPQCMELLLPALQARWNGLPDDDHRLIPLLECMGHVVEYGELTNESAKEAPGNRRSQLLSLIVEDGETRGVDE